MKKIVTLFLMMSMVMAITIIAYGATTTKSTSAGKYSLSSTLTSSFKLIAKDQASGMTTNTTQDVLYADSHTYVYLQALDKNGTVKTSDTQESSKIYAIAYLETSCKSFRVKSYLMEPDYWKCRLSSDWIKHDS